MTPRILKSLSVIAVAALAAGCSADGSSMLSTASVSPEKTAVAAKVDPACVALSSQIDTLRNEGSVDRLTKAAEGKSSSVQVKRASLAKQAELNKANADFQTRCGPKIPAPQTAQVAPQASATKTVAQVGTAAQTTAQTAAAHTAHAATTAATAAAATNN